MILSNLLAPMNAPVCDRLWLLDYTQIVRDYGKDLQKMCLTGARCASGAQKYYVQKRSETVWKVLKPSKFRDMVWKVP